MQTKKEFKGGKIAKDEKTTKISKTTEIAEISAAA